MKFSSPQSPAFVSIKFTRTCLIKEILSFELNVLFVASEVFSRSAVANIVVILSLAFYSADAYASFAV